MISTNERVLAQFGEALARGATQEASPRRCSRARMALGERLARRSRDGALRPQLDLAHALRADAEPRREPERRRSRARGVRESPKPDGWRRPPRQARLLRDSRRRARRGRRQGDQVRLPQARAAVPPGPNPGDREAEELQGGGGGLRRALRPREARALRPLRPPGRGRRRRRRLRPVDLRATSRTSSATSSASAMGGGGRRRRRPATPGADLRYDLEIDLRGGGLRRHRTIEIPRLESCDDCARQRRARRQRRRRLPGLRRRAARCASRQGFFTVARTCPQCRGEGA